MRKIVASVGLVAVSATGLHAAYNPGLTRMEASKPWSISAALRGFYDDNYLSQPSGFAEDSFGFEVTPTLSINYPMDTSTIAFRYTYSLKYYEARSDDPIDQAHEASLRMEHKFSERASAAFEDAFVYSQEPEVVAGGGDPITDPLTRRTDSDVMRNRLRLAGKMDFTEVLGVEGGYQNLWYNYDQNGVASREALLDRFEHLFNVAGLYRVRPDTAALLGYQFGMYRYTGDDPIYGYDLSVPPDGTLDVAGPDGSIRDNNSHYFYVAAQHSVSRSVRGEARLGAQFTDYDNLGQSDWSPYAELSGTYEYLPGSYLQAGFKHVRNATDLVGFDPSAPDPNDITLDQETSLLYASLVHRITPQITGSLLGQWQSGEFNGGSIDGEVDNMYLLGVNLEYAFTQNWAAEAGYNFDRLDSDIPFRSFSRNRVYLGVRATY